MTVAIDPLTLVVAKLRRMPQDRLQAAVVLEAWAGRKAPASFGVTFDHLARMQPGPSRASAVVLTAPPHRWPHRPPRPHAR